jgi:glycosyltransferase involved in cell wall biosynthesis
MALIASALPAPWTASVLSMQDGPYRSVLEGLGVDVHVVPRHFRFDVTPAIRMWQLASALAPDVVHSWVWMSTLAMVPFCRTRGIPLVNGTIRRGDLPPRRARLYRLGIRLSDVVVANSKAGLAAFGIAEGPGARVIYNGFDPTRLDGLTAAAARTGPEDGRIVVMAARMVPAKDWDLFFAAARSLSADGRGWRFVAVGDGPERDRLVAETADLAQSGVVEFSDGGMEALPAIAAADIGVLLTDPRSHAEGCSNSIMEYMACGMPVVCTDSGGNPELVGDGVGGLLVPPHDVGSLVTTFEALRADAERAREMGRRGRERLEALCDVPAMVASFVSLYDSLTRARGLTPATSATRPCRTPRSLPPACRSPGRTVPAVG